MSEVYSSNGKPYNGEKAIISLTSWKARINTVSKTLYSLLQQCPGFHIVLVLSEEEFPQKEKELPENLMLFVENNLIELLWVYKNYKAFKKVLFTMDKYRDVPVISADDDLLYVNNYAEFLYEKWKTLKTYCIGLSATGYEKQNGLWTAGIWGYAQLFPPKFFNNKDFAIINKIVDLGCIDDDTFYNVYRQKHNINAFSFQLSFIDNNFVKPAGADQTHCITKLRISHKLNDKKIYEGLLNVNHRQ